MPIVQQIQKRMLVSLAQIAKDMNLHEGDYLAFEERDGGIFLRPVTWIDRNQAYFWTEEWQEKMRRSEEALANGEYERFETMDDCIRDLEEKMNARHSQDKTI